jgi:hypothetical protein
MNNDDIENLFSWLWRLCGGCKPELSQCYQMLDRADYSSMIAADAECPFTATGKGPTKYNATELQRAEGVTAFNNGLNLDPQSSGAQAYRDAQQKEASKVATAANETVRSHHKAKGIGKLGQ